jgi:hypothetical protein
MHRTQYFVHLVFAEKYMMRMESFVRGRVTSAFPKALTASEFLSDLTASEFLST